MALPISFNTHINELPAEMIDHIMSYLPLADRKSASLMCKKWEEQAFADHFSANIQLILNDHSDKHLDVKLLRKSWRTYRCVTVKFGNTEIDVALIILMLETLGKRIEIFSCETKFRPRQLQEVLKRLPNIRRLVWIDVVNDGETGATLQEFPVLNHLVDLRTTEAFFDILGMDACRIMPSLRILSLRCHLNETEYTSMALSSLSARLKMLGVYYLRWPFQEVLDLSQLETLKLWGLNIFTSTESLRPLFENVPMLKVLVVSVQMSTSLFEVICTNCPQLISFEFIVVSMDHVPFSALRKLTNLEILRVEGYLTHQMIHGCEPLPTVKNFFLRWAKKRLGPERFAKQLHYILPNVQIFHLAGTKEEMDHEFLDYFGKLFTNIKELTIGHFQCPSTDGFNWIGDLVNVEQLTLHRMPLENMGCQRGSKNVTKVRLECLDQLMGTSLLQASDIFPSLRLLEIVHCALITAQDVEVLRQVMPHCVINFVEG